MNNTELLSLARLRVPAATSNVISDANALIILNNGVLDICRKTKCLPTYATFDVVADQLEYDLSSLITDYLCPIERGLFYYDESDYEEMDYVTLEYFNDNHSDWLTSSSSAPERAFILGDQLTVNPPGSSNITDGFLMYYCKKPPRMDGTTYLYPFGGVSEIPHLSSYQTVVVDYYEWQAYRILDINQPNSPRRSRAKANYFESITNMASELREYLNAVLLRSKKAGMKAGRTHNANPF